MRIIQSRIFEKKVKKLTIRQKDQLDAAIREIIKSPSVGQLKKGDLQNVRVHKFHIDNSLYLLAYSITNEQMELIMLGPHENYYSALKKYLRKR